MNVLKAAVAAFTGRPLAATLPAVSPETIARAETEAKPDDQAVAELGAEGPAVTALRLEVQQLRLLKMPAGNYELARQLRETRSRCVQQADRLEELQTLNESLTRELRAANDALRQAGIEATP
jgi:hypothetical protein